MCIFGGSSDANPALITAAADDQAEPFGPPPDGQRGRHPSERSSDGLAGLRWAPRSAAARGCWGASGRPYHQHDVGGTGRGNAAHPFAIDTRCRIGRLSAPGRLGPRPVAVHLVGWVSMGSYHASDGWQWVSTTSHLWLPLPGRLARGRGNPSRCDRLIS